MPLVTCPDCQSEISDAAPACPRCGRPATAGTVSAEAEHASRPLAHGTTATIRCPACGSDQVHGGNKGFGLGKAAVGAALLGPVGLLGGVVGSKKVTVGCLSCGHRWEPKPYVPPAKPMNVSGSTAAVVCIAIFVLVAIWQSHPDLVVMAVPLVLVVAALLFARKRGSRNS